MTGLLILLAAIFTGCSCYYLSCAFADIPTVRTSKAMMTTRKQTGSGSEKLFDVYLTRIARLLAPVIRLDPVKRGKLQTTLEIAELSLTPEAYTAKAFFKCPGSGISVPAAISHHALTGISGSWTLHTDVVLHLLWSL